MKTFLVCLLTLGITAAHAAESAKPGPEIVWLNDNAEATPEEAATETDLTFTFRNDGKEPLTVVAALPHCECTTVDYDREPVPPGKTGTITATFHPEHRVGRQEKGVSVYFDKYTNREKTLIFTVTLPDYYKAEPRYFTWTAGKPMELLLTFQDRQKPVEITGLDLDENFPATAKLEPAGPQVWRLVLTPKPGAPEALEMDGHLFVLTDSRLPRFDEIPFTIRNAIVEEPNPAGAAPVSSANAPTP